MGFNYKIILVFALLGVLLLMCCCKKKETYVHVPDWSVADEQTLAYLFQPKGTVFIYKDSVSGVFDTVTVIGRVTDTTEVWNEQMPDGPYYYEQGQWQDNYSSYEGGATSYFARLGSPYTSTYFMLVKSKWGLGLGQSYFLQCPFYETLEVSSRLFYTKIEKFHTVLVNNGQTYTDVFEIFTKKESTEDYADVRYFYAKNIGLVKKINYKANTNWNLIVIQHP